MTQDNNRNKAGIKVVGLNQVETEQKKRRRRRRRRVNNKSTSSDSNLCSVFDDSSICATVSLSSDDSSTSTSMSTTTKTTTRTSPQEHYKNQQHQQQRKKKNQSSRKKKQQIEDILSLDEKERYLALDSEMVGVGEGGIKSSVARVTLVDWDGRIVWDEFVRQDQEVTDYRTFVSGITPLDLEDAVVTFAECRRKVQAMIFGRILIGHGLKNDLKALHISHPWHATRDTAKYNPFMKTRFDDNVLWPRKLKELALENLKRKIQREGEPHSAYEDAVAAMDLYQMVRKKWEKVMDYKIMKTNEIEQNLSLKISL